MKFAQAALLALLVAGCAGHSAPPNDPGTNPSESGSPTTTDGAVVVPPQGNLTQDLLPGEITVDGCTGIDVLQDFPFPFADTEVPSGWQARQDLTNLNIQVLECERISAGPFERGPVTIAFDYHNAAVFPDECQQGTFDNLRILHGVWINDTEVAAWLRQAYGMPAWSAVFSHTEASGDGYTTGTWRIGPEGATPSEIALDDLDEERLVATINVFRMFWTNALGGVSYYNLAEDSHSDNLAMPAHGILHAPFLMNNLGVNEFVASTSAPVRQVSLSGPIVAFQDTLCTKPL